MRLPGISLRILAIAAAFSLYPAASQAVSWRIPVTDVPPGFSVPANDIVFEYTVPLNELRPSGWTDRQQKKINGFRDRMRQRDELFLLIRVSLDPIGRTAENGILADDVGQAVAIRLVAVGIPSDRILIVPGREEKRPLGEPRLPGLRPYRKVEIIGLLGGDWLRRPKPAPVVVRKPDPPPPVGTVLLEPSEGTTDRANHTLRGTTDPSIGTVTVAIGREARTVSVAGGAFEGPISLRPGENLIVVTGIDRFGRTVRTSRTVRYNPPRPTIDIASPAENTVIDVTRSPVVVVRGSIRSRTPLKEAYLIQNDIPRKIHVREDGTFEQSAILVTEEDTFQVEALDVGGQTGISVVRPVRARGVADRPLMAILHWDEGDVDLDLHVSDPSGNHTYFDAADPLDAPGAIPEGKLWIDNRRGFGPEVFTIERDVPGEYDLSVEYYRGKKACRVYLTLVLFAGTPSRKLVRIYGPVILSPQSAAVTFARITLPSGTVRDLSGTTVERVHR